MKAYSAKLPLIKDEREATQRPAGCSCSRKNQSAAPANRVQTYRQPNRSSRAISNTNLLQVAWSIAVLYLLVKIASK